MIKLFFALLFIIGLTSCNGSSSTKVDKVASSIPTTGAGTNSAEPFDLSFILNNVDGSNLTTYNHADQSLGEDVGGVNTRYTVVVASSANSTVAGTVSSATIAGVTADIRVQNTSDNVTCAVLTADTTGLGAIGTINITYSRLSAASSIGIYRLINPSSIIPDATIEDIVDASGLIDVSLAVSAGGGSVSGSSQLNGGSNTWVGASEVYDVVQEAVMDFSGALNFTSGAPQTITTQSLDTTPVHMTGCSASWH